MISTVVVLQLPVVPTNPAVVLAGIFAILAFFRHVENIIRLVKGTESKIKFGTN